MTAPALADKAAVAVIISGRGSNMQALVNAATRSDYPARIVTVISNRPDAAGLGWAKEKGIPTTCIDHKAYASRADFDAELHKAIVASGADLVALAGFMRIMTADFVEQWH